MIPENEFMVGHFGAEMWLSVQSSSGRVDQIQLTSKNQDMTRYLTERFSEFQEKYPEDCIGFTGRSSDESATVEP